jgi:hypothetical protein
MQILGERAAIKKGHRTREELRGAVEKEEERSPRLPPNVMVRTRRPVASITSLASSSDDSSVRWRRQAEVTETRAVW